VALYLASKLTINEISGLILFARYINARMILRYGYLEPEKPSDQFLGLIVMSHWLDEVWIWIQDISVILTLSLFRLKNRVCLSHDVQVAGVAWWTVMRIVTEVGDLVQRIGDGHKGWVLSGQTIRRSGDTVCCLHRARADEERWFFGWTSKSMSMICQWFDLKITGMVSPGLTSKPMAQVFWFES
jgi:hypothetical protein